MADVQELTMDEAMEIVSGQLGLNGVAASEYCTAHDGGLFYFISSVRGGGAGVVGPDRQPLYANSSISPEDHLAAYRSGRRS